jgi:hypothetical protein
MEMNEKKSVSRFVKLAKSARNLGLFLLGLGIYFGVVAVFFWLICFWAVNGNLKIGEAVFIATMGTTMLQMTLLGFSV